MNEKYNNADLFSRKEITGSSPLSALTAIKTLYCLRGVTLMAWINAFSITISSFLPQKDTDLQLSLVLKNKSTF